MGRITHRDTQMMMARLLSQRENVAKYWVTVTAGQTHTIWSLGIAAGKSAVVTWGDGLSNEYTGTDTRTHVYASAGTYAVKIYTPENVLTFNLRDREAVSVLNSADLKGMVNVISLTLATLTNASITLNSADMVDWRPSTFYLSTLPNATITFNSADMVDWRPSIFHLYNVPSASITLNSADMVDWRPSTFYLHGLQNASITLNSADWVDWRPSSFYLGSLPSASIMLNSADMVDWRPSSFTLIVLPNASITFNSADMVDWRPSTFTLDYLTSDSITLNSADLVDWRPSNFNLISLRSASITLNSADWVDWRPGGFSIADLPSATITITPSTIKNWSTAINITLRTGNLTQAQCDLVLWECYQIARVVTGGTINLAIVGNAAPSGTFQPCQSPTVTASTPGMEIAYELLNDSLGVGFNKWTAVLTN